MIAIFTAGLRRMDTHLLRYRLMLVLYTNVHDSLSTGRERGTGKRKWRWEMVVKPHTSLPRAHAQGV